MKPQEGRLFLQDCLDQWQVNERIDDLIIYKSANKSLAEYHDDRIPTIVSEEVFADHKYARYVVKFLRFDNVYVAWDVTLGRGNGNYPVFRRQVTDFLKGKSNLQCVHIFGNAHAIIFRRDVESVNEFLQKYLLQYRS